MPTNKEIKKKGFETVKKHYLLLLILCVITVLFGNEYASNAGVFHVSELFSKGPISEQQMPSFTTIPLRDNPGDEVIKDILHNDLIAGTETAQALSEQFESSGTDVEGHTSGVIAYLVNTVSSGTMALTIFSALDKITGSNTVAKIIFVILGLLLYTFFFVALPEIYVVAMRRMFMEARVYDRVPLHHALHLLRVRRCARATLCIVLKDLLYFLWCLTIAGIFIKRYSYYLVPYIVAENPDIKPREAIKLSRAMMYGHKMEAFKFEMSFIPWLLLGIVTFGLSNVFFYLPYKLSSVAEYHACIRKISKEAGIEGTEMLDDDYLFEKADGELREKAFADVTEERKDISEREIHLEGIYKFFAEKLAIWVGTTTHKAAYQEIENRKFRLSEALDARDGIVYPIRLDPRTNENNRKASHQINFLRCYTIWNLLFMFLLFAFIGWVWEVIVFLFQTGEFVNRGTLHGPWLPIYGTGGTLMIVLLSSLRKKPVIEFFSIVVLCGAIEYFTSWLLEEMYGMRWWDYSGYFLNLDGRICLEGLIAFGVLGMMGIYILAPSLDTLLMKINPKVMTPLTIGLIAIFCGDVVYSNFYPNQGTGITDMGRIENKNNNYPRLA